MTPEELQSLLTEMEAFLTDLDTAVPNLVGEDLLLFLTAVKDNQWLTNLLLNSIESTKQLKNVKLFDRKGR